MYCNFEKMSPDSRVWVYQADRKLTEEEQTIIGQELRTFCEQWNTHGANMSTSFDIRYDQIIILAVDESQMGASGCSIDSSVRALRNLEQKFNINLLDHGKISFFSQADQLEVYPALGIKSKVSEGLLTKYAIVLNPLVKLKSDLDQHWLIPAQESWLNKFFDN